MDSQKTTASMDDELEKIQPHGALLVLDKNLHVIQYSENISKLMEVPLHQIAVSPIANFLSHDDSKESILPWLANTHNQYKRLCWRCKNTKIPIWAHIQQKSDYIILEIEPILENKIGYDDLFDLSQYVFANNKSSTNTLNLQQTLQNTCEEIRKMTGYDRVSIYQIDPQDNTSVITGESHTKGMTSYLNLHFHQEHISQEIQATYLNLSLQYTPTIDATPVNIIPSINPITEKFLDLSQCELRMLNQKETQHIKKMGAISALSIAITQDNKLWGLINCLHHEAKYVSINSRLILTLIASTLGKQIFALESLKNAEHEQRITKIQTSLTRSVTEHESLIYALDNNHAKIMELLFATGMSIYFQGNLFNYGKTPSNKEVLELIQWLKTNNFPQLTTDSLPSQFKESTPYKEIACGLLAMPLTELKDNFIMFYRPELIHSVAWADKVPVTLKHDARKSLRCTIQTITQHSLSWSTFDIKSCEFIRGLIASKQLHDLLQIKAMHDPLTGLLNHIYLDEQLKVEILRAARDSQTLTLMQLNLDSFRKIAAELGAQAGNIILAVIAKLLRSFFRGYDFIYNNNEEFILLLPGMNQKTAMERAQLLKRNINDMKIQFAGKILPSMTVSFGIATYPEHGSDELLLKNVSRNALTLAIKNGGNQIVLADPNMTHEIKQDKRIT